MKNLFLREFILKNRSPNHFSYCESAYRGLHFRLTLHTCSRKSKECYHIRLPYKRNSYRQCFCSKPALEPFLSKIFNAFTLHAFIPQTLEVLNAKRSCRKYVKNYIQFHLLLKMFQLVTSTCKPGFYSRESIMKI